MIVPVLVVAVCGPALAQQKADTRALNRAIDQTLRAPEFAWRTPVEDDDAPEIVNWAIAAVRSVQEVLGKVFRWIRDWLQPPQRRLPEETQPGGWSVQYWLAGLAVIAIGILLVVLIRTRRRRPPAVLPDAAPMPIDVREETVIATALPEDEWLRLAEQFVAAGDWRLALRALHLACLRVLAEQDLIRVEHWKTGMEYLDELRRRSRQNPDLAARFRENLGLFEFGWYSRHAVEPGIVDSYRIGLEEIRQHAR